MASVPRRPDPILTRGRRHAPVKFSDRRSSRSPSPPSWLRRPGAGLGPHRSARPTWRSAGAPRGVFATVCQYSHAAPDDPIVQPGRPGALHLHHFFGNVTTAAASTYDSLRAGSTTCVTGQDASGYSVPALYKNGVEVEPRSAKVYYRIGHHEQGSVSAFPPGSAWWPAMPAPRRSRVAASPSGRVSASIRRPRRRHLALARRSVDAARPVPGRSAGPGQPRQPDAQGARRVRSLRRLPGDYPAVLPSLSLIVRYPLSGDRGPLTLASCSSSRVTPILQRLGAGLPGQRDRYVPERTGAMRRARRPTDAAGAARPAMSERLRVLD